MRYSETISFYIGKVKFHKLKHQKEKDSDTYICLEMDQTQVYEVLEVRRLSDTFFRQIKSFIRFCLAFVFGLQTYYLIHFSKMYQNVSIKGSGVQKQRLNEILLMI